MIFNTSRKIIIILYLPTYISDDLYDLSGLQNSGHLASFRIYVTYEIWLLT